MYYLTFIILSETTYVKEINEISISSDAALGNFETICDTPTLLFKQPQDVIISDTLNGDDTTNHLLSLTQIKNFVGEFFFHSRLIYLMRSVIV